MYMHVAYVSGKIHTPRGWEQILTQQKLFRRSIETENRLIIQLMNLTTPFTGTQCSCFVALQLTASESIRLAWLRDGLVNVVLEFIRGLKHRVEL